VAVIAHIFYVDMAAELLSYIEHIPLQADLFISTDCEIKKIELGTTFADYMKGSVDIRVFPNRGRDIAPMLVGFSDVFERYEIFLHVHSKKSPHNSIFGSWRNFLLSNLIGSGDIVRSIIDLFQTTDVGVVFSQHLPQVRGLLNFGGNFETMACLLAKEGVKLSKDLVLEFPSSSFFWARTSVFKPLLAQGFTWSDFPEEAGQNDGTLAHAIERSILFFAESTGLRWAKVGQASLVQNDTLVSIQAPEEIAEGLLRAHSPLLGNRLTSWENRRLVGEINPIGTRRDDSTRPRLTLILPTLQPKKIFGGITTALRLFHDLAAAFGDEFDYRILSVSEPVDLSCMLPMPDYTLLTLGVVHDELARTVIDASDGSCGHLSVRRNDIFIATAWWTAVNAFAFRNAQQLHHNRACKIVYLIQDHEPDFYGWSSQYGLARQTYLQSEATIALINSEELAAFMAGRYGFTESYMVPFTINPSIKNRLQRIKRDRIILIYGRPGTPRNAFQIICSALVQWQQEHPTVAETWKIVSVGEEIPKWEVSQLKNLEVFGKLSLDAYAEMLSKSSVGISLMLSPHPSYPPLEMAYAGMRVITNNFEGKDLSRRSRRIVSVTDINEQGIAEALAGVVLEAEKDIGRIVGAVELLPIPCVTPKFSPTLFSKKLRKMVQEK
jgi:hypothetical protein